MDFGIQWLYRNMESYMSADLDSFNGSTGLFGVTGMEGEYLDLSPFIKITRPSGLSILLRWDGQMLGDKDILHQMLENKDILHSVHSVYSIYSEIEYNRDDFGLFFSGKYSLDPFISIPAISMGIHYAISEGVELSLEGNDILGFFSEDRSLWGNYIKDGGTVTLVTKIFL